MKKLTAILLLIICLQYTFGLYVVYVFNQLEIKQQMRQAIRTGLFQPDEVVTLTLPLEKFAAARQGYGPHDEIKFAGKLYDIISIQQQAGTIIIKCLCDEDENRLVASFVQFAQKARQFPDKKVNVSSNVFSPFILSDICYSLPQPVISKTPFLQTQMICINSRFHHVPTPPPWRVS